MTLVFVAAPSAQSPQPAGKSRDYTRALDLYREGKYAASVDLVVTIPRDTLSAAVDDETTFDVKHGDVRRLEIAAVMLLDIAYTAFLKKDPWSIDKRSRADSVMRALHHIGAKTPAVRAWYLAEAALLEGGHDFRGHHTQLADAREFFPRDARILMASGSGLETEGKNLDDAVAFYRASLAVDGSNAECRVRLARVLLRLGDPAASLAELDRMPAPAEERIAYLRELFRASALAALKRPPDAERKFVGALEWNSQAPYLGLAESMAARGDDASARKVIAKLLTANVDEEPWAAYMRGQWRYFPALLDEARQALK